MKQIIMMALSLFAASAFAKDMAATTMMKPAKMKMSDFVVMMPSDIKWMPVEGMQGVSMAEVEGHINQNHHSFMKFNAGFAAPLHAHTANHFVTVVAGTLVLTVDGTEHRLPAGSYFAFKNKKAHTTSCAAGAECIIFSDVRGKWDVLSENEKMAKNMKSKSSDFVVMMPSDIKWTSVEAFPGVHTAVVEGDAMKGQHHSFMKFDSNFNAPLHMHSSDHFVSVIAGTMLLTVDGVEHRLPTGSYFSFKNKKTHISGCAAGAECLVFADVRGKWDVVPQKPSTISSVSSSSDDSSTH